jgi:hypothetical protein
MVAMNEDVRVVLTSLQGGLATLEVHYGQRHARIELDQLEDRYPGQRTEERANEELTSLATAITSWLKNPTRRIEGA